MRTPKRPMVEEFDVLGHGEGFSKKAVSIQHGSLLWGGPRPFRQPMVEELDILGNGEGFYGNSVFIQRRSDGWTDFMPSTRTRSKER